MKSVKKLLLVFAGLFCYLTVGAYEFLKACHCFVFCAIVFMASCSTAQKATVEEITNIEGEKVVSQTITLQGITMAETLNEEGTAITKLPFKWYAGIGRADNKQVAVELAQREAYATISRVLTNAVHDTAQRGNLANNGRVQQALTSHWEQVSLSLQKGCEPLGDVTIEYSPQTRMYQVVAKVAIRGDRFNQLLNTAGSFKPNNLTGEELDKFVQINKTIMEAAKGN